MQIDWIKCSDRLPDAAGQYLTRGKYSIVTLWYCDGWNCFEDRFGHVEHDNEINDVTHWANVRPDDKYFEEE